MKRRDATFISRIFILSMVALAFSIGATIVLESEELTKVVPRTKFREFLMFFAPLVSIMLVQYTYAIKSFGMRSLLTEGLVFAFAASFFLAVTSIYFFADVVVLQAYDCPWWKVRGCPETIIREPNYLLGGVTFAVGIAALLVALWREGFLSRR